MLGILCKPPTSYSSTDTHSTNAPGTPPSETMPYMYALYVCLICMPFETSPQGLEREEQGEREREGHGGESYVRNLKPILNPKP